MATVSPIARIRRIPPGKAVPAPESDSRFDRRQAEILAHAAEVFCDKGYEGASMRDLSRASGMSLAGLYHYFESKEKLLYLIQKDAFTTIHERLRVRLKGIEDAEERLRAAIDNHLDYFLANRKVMKVMSHEDDVLKNGYGKEVAALRREYFNAGLALVDDLKRAKGLQFSGRLAVLSLFGMMNWIYTWYNPRLDGSAEEIAREMADTFLRGLLNKRKKRRT